MPHSQIVLGSVGMLGLALLLAGWVAVALAVAVWGWRRGREGRAAARRSAWLSDLLDQSPAANMEVAGDGTVRGQQRLARWLALDRLPDTLAGLGAALNADDLAHLCGAIEETRRTGRPFAIECALAGGAAALAFRGAPNRQLPGSVLVWAFDLSGLTERMRQVADDAAMAREDVALLAGLVAAAPMPIWLRGADGRLELVNNAYATAVGAENPGSAIAGGVELIEQAEGEHGAQVAARAMRGDRAITRVMRATIAGQRRTLEVTDQPLGGGAVAGYALDIAEREQLAAQLRRFGEAQRALLDALSAGIAQFDPGLALVFANRPFARLGGIDLDRLGASPQLGEVFERMREAGRLPEVRDFPEWRRERLDWAAAHEPVEEAWMLPDGTHLRVIGQPLPEGGLLLVLEDRTEQFRLSSARDSLVRTSGAIFDQLVEGLAVFGPDGRLVLWNTRFAEHCPLPGEYLAGRPHVSELFGRLPAGLLADDACEAVAGIVRAATLDRVARRGRIATGKGRALDLGGVPLPDGTGLLTMLEAGLGANLEVDRAR